MDRNWSNCGDCIAGMKLKMIKKKLILLGIVLLVLPLVYALDQSLPIACGGDEELIIACGPADENLTFLSRDVPPEEPGGPGGGGSWVTPPGTNYTEISFDIFGTNTGDHPVTNMQIVDASPIEFKDALPNTTQSLATGETNKLLWMSDLINTTPLESYPQPITFWVNISGTVEIYTFHEQASIDLTIEPWINATAGPTPGFAISFSDISFLEEGGFLEEDVVIIKWVLGVIILVPVIYLIKRRKKKKRTKKEKEKEGIPIIELKKKEKKGPLIDILLIIIIIILLLSILFIPVKEEKMIGLKVHYYRNGVEITGPISEASSSYDLFYSWTTPETEKEKV